MMAEMRGDMPGNFFAWILRYPEQDDVIIVLRNGYGSTERLEQNLQAILFDREPHLPRRSPLDIAAQVGWVSVRSEERRVGKECRYRWLVDGQKKKNEGER